MKRALIIGAVVFLGLAGAAVGSEIGDLPWNESNIEALRSFDKAAVVKFSNNWAGTEGIPGAMTADQLNEFEWVDLAGDGKYELVTTASFGPCCVFLGIYSKDTAGKVSLQSLDGAGKLSETVRDLNGDGKMELVIWTELAAPPGSWSPMTATPRWPAVYRLESGKYVEASRDFPNFYDSEIRPELAQASVKGQQEVRRNPAYGDNVARLVLEKDKLLRMLGRDPTAGLQDAYQWMGSGSSQLVQCAIATFADIGGHEKELSAANQALKPAIQHEIQSRKGG
jgi:hypothetical protein